MKRASVYYGNWGWGSTSIWTKSLIQYLQWAATQHWDRCTGWEKMRPWEGKKRQIVKRAEKHQHQLKCEWARTLTVWEDEGAENRTVCYRAISQLAQTCASILMPMNASELLMPLLHPFFASGSVEVGRNRQLAPRIMCFSGHLVSEQSKNACS